MQTVKNKEEIKVPEKIAVFTDKKTSVKTVAFPFSFPDGNNGILSITKLVKMGFLPSQEIESIIINFK